MLVAQGDTCWTPISVPLRVLFNIRPFVLIHVGVTCSTYFHYSF
jgi:hypothetical protein